ncbi:MAG: folate family ECF transporter S component [Oscillospiraceae bacterium]
MALFKMFADSAKELKSLRCITVTAMMIALNLALKSVTINVTDDLKISFSYIALATIGMLFGPTVGFLAGTITDILGLLVQQMMSMFNPLFTLVEAIGGMLYGCFLYRLQPVKFSKEMFSPNSDRNTALLGGINAKLLSLFMAAAVFILYNIYHFNELFVVYVIIIAFVYGVFLHKLAALPWKQLLRVIGAKVSVAFVCNIVMTPAFMVVSGIWSSEVLWNVKIPVRLVKNAIQVPVDIMILILILFPIMAAYKSIFKNTAAKKKTAAGK